MIAVANLFVTPRVQNSSRPSLSFISLVKFDHSTRAE